MVHEITPSRQCKTEAIVAVDRMGGLALDSQKRGRTPGFLKEKGW